MRGEKVVIRFINTSNLVSGSKERKVPANLVNRINEFGYMSFSLDDERLITLSTELEPIVLLWSWDSSNYLNYVARYRISGSPNCFEVKISPHNSNIFSVLGKGHFKLLNYSSGDEMGLQMNSVFFKDSKPTVIFELNWSRITSATLGCTELCQGWSSRPIASISTMSTRREFTPGCTRIWTR